MKAVVSALFLAVAVWMAQVTPAEQTPDILCGCTEVLKNFA